MIFEQQNDTTNRLNVCTFSTSVVSVAVVTIKQPQDGLSSPSKGACAETNLLCREELPTCFNVICRYMSDQISVDFTGRS